VDDYNKQYGKSFDRKVDPQFKILKEDIINRLSHKKEYKRINDHNDMIDILIVVDQMLTGFDSQYVNTLYLDRVLETDNLIQAISRTNRIYDKEEKPFGIFRFYRKPYTMQKNLDDALRLYCEGDTSGVRVADIDENIIETNNLYDNICKIFSHDSIIDFCCLPKDDIDCQKFKKEFGQLKIRMNSIKLQGFKWDNEYGEKLFFNEKTYQTIGRQLREWFPLYSRCLWR
jgi:type I restriction enzyme R subunit